VSTELGTREWTDEDDALLVEMYDGYSLKEIGARLARTPSSVRSRARRLRTQGFSVPHQRPVRRFSDADDAAIVELYKSCTPAQVARYLERSTDSIIGRAGMLRKKGILTIKQKPGKTSGNSFWLPSGAILLAKTCPKCGDLRGAELFTRRSCGYYQSECRICKRGSDLDSYHQKGMRHGANYKAQKITLERATHQGQPYTSRDIDVISDPDTSPLKAALDLGRTYFGILAARQRMGISPKKKVHTDARWDISLPSEIERVRQQIRFIGCPVPEEMWEWDESDIGGQEHRPHGRKSA
jgi:hypothetical protein